VAIELALFNSSAKKSDEPDANELLIKEEEEVLVRLNCNNITYLETDGNYVMIYLADEKK